MKFTILADCAYQYETLAEAWMNARRFARDTKDSVTLIGPMFWLTVHPDGWKHWSK